MKKKGLVESTLVILIISVFALALIIGFTMIYKNIVTSNTNSAVISTWVAERGASKGVVGEKYPPIPELSAPLVLESKDLKFDGSNYPKAYKEIADSMYDCWKAFDNGQTDFIKSADSPLQAVKTIKKTSFCYPCRIITFSDDAKRDVKSFKGLIKYMNENKPLSVGNVESPTYLQYLSNDPSYVLTDEEINQMGDDYETKNDFVILLFAASGRTWAQIGGELLGIQSGELDETQAYAPTNIDESKSAVTQVTDTESGVFNIGAAGATKALTNKYSNKAAASLAKSMGDVGIKVGVETTVKAGSKVGSVAGVAGAEAMSEFTFVAAEKTSSKLIVKGVGKVLVKNAARVLGAKIIPGIGQIIFVSEATLGAYRMVFNPNPFIATTMLAESNEYLSKCNIEESQSLQEAINPQNLQSPSELQAAAIGGNSQNANPA